jgi:hypothetical protein
MDAQGAKTCGGCREVKPFASFHNDKTRHDGLRYYCKVCGLARAKKWKAENPGKVKAGDAKRYAEKSEMIKVAVAKWRAENPEKMRANIKKQDARRAAELRDSYIRTALRIPIADCPPELIEAKREQLAMHRLGKAIKAELKKEPS